MSKINTTIALRDYVDLQNFGPLQKKIWVKLVKFLELESLHISTPLRWHNLSPSELRAVKVISFLRKEGLATKLETGINTYPDEPFMHIVKLHPRGNGADLFHKERALWSAIGENLERVLWKNSGEILFRDSFVSSSKKLTENFLNLDEIRGFSEEKKKELWSTSNPAKDIGLRWIKVATLTRNSPQYIPYQLVDPYYQKKSAEPLIRSSISTGLATSSDTEEAIVKGMLEIIERDAFMINYLNKISPPCVNLEELALVDEEIYYIVTELKRYSITPHLSLLATDFPTHVAFATLTDEYTPGPTVSVGARASFSLKTAIIDALNEALSVRLYQKSLGKSLPKEPLGRIGRLIYWSNKRNASGIDFMFNGPKKILSSENLDADSGSATTQLQLIQRHLEKKGYDGYYINITPKKIQRRTGITSVLSIIPQLQPMHLDESIPYFGGERLSSVPKELGYGQTTELNKEPHPFP